MPTKVAEEISLDKLNSNPKSNLLAESLEGLWVDADTRNSSFRETKEKWAYPNKINWYICCSSTEKGTFGKDKVFACSSRQSVSNDAQCIFKEQLYEC